MKNINDLAEKLLPNERSRVISIKQHLNSGITINIVSYNDAGVEIHKTNLSDDGTVHSNNCPIELIEFASEIKKHFKLNSKEKTISVSA